MAAWNAVRIPRRSEYGLFTFGESELPYFLITEPAAAGKTVGLSRGMVRITRPLIMTADNAPPELQSFFDSGEEESFARFMLARSASLRHLRFNNERGPEQTTTDSVEEAIDRLKTRLDSEEDDRTAILVAPANMAGFAVMRYAAEQVLSSAPDNIQELRERGFLK